MRSPIVVLMCVLLVQPAVARAQIEAERAPQQLQATGPAEPAGDVPEGAAVSSASAATAVAEPEALPDNASRAERRRAERAQRKRDKRRGGNGRR